MVPFPEVFSVNAETKPEYLKRVLWRLGSWRRSVTIEG
jgi:hypothetical protein